MGDLKRIETPRDRGEEGRLGAFKGRRQQSQDVVEVKLIVTKGMMVWKQTGTTISTKAAMRMPRPKLKGWRRSI